MKMKRKITVIAMLLTLVSLIGVLVACDKADTEHVHNFNIKSIDIKYLKAEATTTSRAIYYYSCACGEKGTETFESGECLVPEHEHNFNIKSVDDKYLKAEATTTSKAVYYYSCACGEKGTETFEYGECLVPEHEHNFIIKSVDDKYLKSEATTTSKAVYYYSCACGEKGTETFECGEYKNDSSDFEFEESEDGYKVFAYIGSKTEVAVPSAYNNKAVTAIGEDAFFDCTRIRKVVLPDTITEIGKNAFNNCVKLKEIVLSQKLVTICENAFYKCSELTSITIPDSVTSIGSSAFYDCSGLTNVTIGSGVTSIGKSAFYGCRFTSVYYTGDIAGWCGINGLDAVLKSGSFPPVQFYIGNKKLEGDLVIPDGVTSIGDYAFYNCSGLTSISIPNSVTSIGDYAFSECINLQYNIYDNAKYLGNSNNPYLVLIKAINKSITSCKINENTKFIHSSAFGDCSKLANITIPDSLISIGSELFTSNRGYVGEGFSVYYTGDIKGWCEISGLYEINFCSHTLYIGGNKIEGDLVIPDGVKSISDCAFYNCSGLTSITIPDSVTSIGERAFSDCSGLTSITIPDSVTSIGDWAFAGCSGLTSVTIGSGVTSIGYKAFYNCSGLTSVTIGSGVMSIGWWAFSGCGGLTKIIFEGTITEWNNIKKETSWAYGTGNYTVYCTNGEIKKQ